LKRFFAIVLLSVHLFYIGGYALVFRYYIHQSDVQIVKQIFDNKVDNAKLIELKIPVNMPTIQDWSDYEEIVGQIQLKDAYYNYVRLRMTRDTMYLICLPNTAKTQLVKANVIAAKEISDVPLNKKGQEPVSKKVNALSEYNLQAFRYQHSAFGISVKQNGNTVTVNLTNPFIESPGKPPNVIS
jgi:hypothetical protein